jgi:tetratricopeptide (TPR) repeat protein
MMALKGFINMMNTQFLSKIFLSWLLVFTACLAHALPTPKEIEAEMQAGNLSKAESMLREVIAEKPQSAKAHYELGQVLAREEHYAQAHQELLKAKEIDPTLKFASSPEKFNTVFDKVSQLQHATPTAQHSVATTPNQSPAAAQTSAINLNYVWIGIAGLVALALIIRIARPAPPAANYAQS